MQAIDRVWGITIDGGDEIEISGNVIDTKSGTRTCDEPSLPSNLLKDRVSPATTNRRLTASNIKQGLVNAEAWWSPGGGGAYVKFTPATSERFHNAGPLDPGFVAAVTVEAWVRLAALDAGNEKVIFNVDDSARVNPPWPVLPMASQRQLSRHQ